MANKNINTATALSTITSGDKVFVSDEGTSLRKADIAAIAKYIVENYAGSTVAGTAQSIKTVLDAHESTKYGLDTANAINIPENADFNTYTTPGNYYVPSATISGTISNYPPHPAAAGTLRVEGVSGTGRKQYFKPWNSARSYQRSYYNNAWTLWFSDDTVMQYYITSTMGGFDGLDSKLANMGASQSYIASVQDSGPDNGGSSSKPDGNNFWFVFGTVNSSGLYAQQTATSFTGTIYRRSKQNSNAWGEWLPFYSGPMRSVKIALSANSSVTVNLANSSRIVAYSITNNVNSQGAFLVSTTSTGSVVFSKISGGEMISASSNASGKITFTSTAPSGGGTLAFLCFEGSVSEAT